MKAIRTSAQMKRIDFIRQQLLAREANNTLKLMSNLTAEERLGLFESSPMYESTAFMLMDCLGNHVDLLPALQCTELTDHNIYDAKNSIGKPILNEYLEKCFKGKDANQLETFEYMVSKTSNLNARGGMWNETALNTAAYYGNLNAIRILLEHGADPSVKNDMGDNTDVAAMGTANQTGEFYRDYLALKHSVSLKTELSGDRKIKVKL